MGKVGWKRFDAPKVCWAHCLLWGALRRSCLNSPGRVGSPITREEGTGRRRLNERKVEWKRGGQSLSLVNAWPLVVEVRMQVSALQSFFFLIDLILVGSVACSILFSQKGPCPLHWEHKVLTTGLPGKSRPFSLTTRFSKLPPWSSAMALPSRKHRTAGTISVGQQMDHGQSLCFKPESLNCSLKPIPPLDSEYFVTPS